MLSSDERFICSSVGLHFMKRDSYTKEGKDKTYYRTQARKYSTEACKKREDFPCKRFFICMKRILTRKTDLSFLLL
jgi:hypothetical protein